jgi:hypothetical protein
MECLIIYSNKGENHMFLVHTMENERSGLGLRRGLLWRFTGLALFTLMTLGIAGCLPPPDPTAEFVLCDELAEEVCLKWYDCWPNLADDKWSDQNECVVDVQYECRSSDNLLLCDIDNSDLKSCNDDIFQSECGDVPETCHDIVDCVE